MNTQNNLSSIRVHQSWINNTNQDNNHSQPKDATIQNDKGSNLSDKNSKINSNSSDKSQIKTTKETLKQPTVQKDIKDDTKVIRSRDDMFGTLLDVKA